MRNLIRFAAWLYPPSWRQRYGVEFAALLEDVRPGWRDLLNVLKGALAMQIRNFGVIAAGFALAGALVAGLVSWRIPDTFVSQAIVKWWPAEARNEVPTLIVNSTSRNSLVAIMNKHNLYERQRAQRPLEEVIEQMRHAIRIYPVRDTAFTVAFLDEDPAKARLVTRELVNTLMLNNVLMRRAASASAERAPGPGLNMEVLDPASLPDGPSSPNRLIIYGLGIAIGALTGAVAAWFRGRTQPRMA